MYCLKVLLSIHIQECFNTKFETMFCIYENINIQRNKHSIFPRVERGHICLKPYL